MAGNQVWTKANIKRRALKIGAARNIYSQENLFKSAVSLSDLVILTHPKVMAAEKTEHDDIPDDLSPEARESLLKIRRRIATITRFERDIARSRWQAPIFIVLTVLVLIWGIGKLMPLMAMN